MSAWGERRWAVSGIAVAVLFFIGFAMIGDTGDNPAEELAWFEENRARALIGFIAFALAGFAHLWFSAALRSLLGAAEGEPKAWTSLGFGSGIVTSVLFVVGAAPIAAASDATGEARAANAESVTTLTSLAYPLLTVGIGFSSLLALATGLVALRTGVLPRWFAWLSIAVAPVILVAVLFIPIFVFLGWLLVASAVLLFSSPRVGSHPA